MTTTGYRYLGRLVHIGVLALPVLRPTPHVLGAWVEELRTADGIIILRPCEGLQCLN